MASLRARQDLLRERLRRARAARAELPEDDLRNTVTSSMHLRGQPHDTKRTENIQAIGGMRNPRSSVKKLWRHQSVGYKVRGAIEQYLADHPHIAGMTDRAMTARDKDVVGPTPEDVDVCRQYVNKVLPMDSTLSTALATLRPDLPSAWLKQAGDPDLYLIEWMLNGTPAGVAEVVPPCRGSSHRRTATLKPRSCETCRSTQTASPITPASKTARMAKRCCRNWWTPGSWRSLRRRRMSSRIWGPSLW